MCMSFDMWVKSGFDWFTYHHRLCFIMQQERLFWGGGHVEKKTQ